MVAQVRQDSETADLYLSEVISRKHPQANGHIKSPTIPSAYLSSLLMLQKSEID